MKLKMTRKFTEATPRARTLINKRKLYGVKTEINSYRSEIINVFYDEEIIKRLFKTNEEKVEALDFVSDYFNSINQKISGLLEKAREFLLNSFKKGALRIQDNKGQTINLGETPDETAIDILLNEQKTYYQNLNEDQSRLVNKIIADGLRKGSTSKEIAGQIKTRVKRLTYARANTIAKTEIVKSHNLGQIKTMQLAGIEYYNYITSNDNKVSEICKKHQGPKGRERIYQVSLAGTPDNPLPVINSHPNCRCTTVIYTKPKQ